jgi:Ca-activated chloride channel family protein
MTFQWLGLLALGFVVPLLVGIYVWSQGRHRPRAARYSSLALIKAAQPGGARLRRHLPFVLLAAAATAVVVAIARPAVVLSVPANQTTIILAMDVSGSMCSTDIEPTRLEAAQEAATSFVTSQRAQTQIGIVAFSGFAAIVQVPTSDEAVLVEAIRSLTTARRTAIGSGILSAIDALAEIDPSIARSVVPGRAGAAPPPVAAGEYAPSIIVLLTDGANNSGPEPVDAARQAADRGLRVYTIGFGSQDGGQMDPVCRQQFIGNEPGMFGGGGGGGFGGTGRFPRGIDEPTLRRVAEITGGAYYPADSAVALEEVFAALPTSLITRTEAVEVSAGFVGLGGLLAALGLLLGRLWRPLP